jgi:hypothetical protein
VPNESALPTALDMLAYPALLYTTDYIYLARQPIDLRLHTKDRSGSRVEHVVRIVDSSGRLFRVEAWRKRSPPLHWKSLVAILVGSSFVGPILTLERQFAIDEFVREIADVIVAGQLYRGCFDDAHQFTKSIAGASTFGELFELLKRLP